MSTIHPSSVVEDGAVVGGGCRIGPFCHVGPEVVLGEGCELISHVVIRGRARVGPGARFFPHCTIGGEPQFVGFDGTITGVEIGARSVFREGSTVSAGIPSFGGVTRIGEGCMLFTNAHVGHDCLLGDNVIMANSTALGGHVHIGDKAFLSACVLIQQHARIGRNAFVGGGTPVTKDIIPFGMANGNPARLHGLNVVGMRRSGLAADMIRRTRNAYRIMFGGEITLQEGIMQVEAEFGDVPSAMSLVEFIRERSDRPILAPERSTRANG